MTDIYQKAYTIIYPSRLGDILLAADEIGLTGLWFSGRAICRYTSGRAGCAGNADTCTGKGMAGRIFSGKEPDFTPKLHPIGSPFRQEVWRILLQIPYGQTMTYGEIARQMEKLQNRPHMSAQAVGGAVGHNGISIIIPCHRVVGTKGNLTGYAGGLDKRWHCLSWSMPIGKLIRKICRCNEYAYLPSP